ncbi:MAG: MBL fold metallo-hydrolase [bacterium]
MTIRIEHVEQDVVRIRLSNWQGRAFGYDVSAFMVRGVLVDTGFPLGRREMLAAVRSLAPRGAIVTHWHEDHAGNAPQLAAMGVPLRMHDECEAMLRARPAIALYRRSIWGRPARLVTPLIDFDPAPLEIISMPGHTTDHQVVWDPERRIVASGDLFLGVKVRVAHDHESPAMLIRSLRAIAALEPRVLLDAHRGGVVRNPVEMLRGKIDWMEEIIGAIVALAEKGASEREILRRVLGGESLVGWVSMGEYSRMAMVRTVLRERSAVTERL